MQDTKEDKSLIKNVAEYDPQWARSIKLFVHEFIEKMPSDTYSFVLSDHVL